MKKHLEVTLHDIKRTRTLDEILASYVVDQRLVQKQASTNLCEENPAARKVQRRNVKIKKIKVEPVDEETINFNEVPVSCFQRKKKTNKSTSFDGIFQIKQEPGDNETTCLNEAPVSCI